MSSLGDIETSGFTVYIYKPDFKYMDPEKAAKYSAGASDYPEVTKKAVLEMHRQVGVAVPASRRRQKHPLARFLERGKAHPLLERQRSL